MKRIFLIVTLFLSISITYSQIKKTKKPLPPPVSSDPKVKENKRIAKIKLKGNVYDVYLKNMKDLMSEQIPTDTLMEYHFTFENAKFSLRSIQKYATIKGKIAREGSYKVKGDTLILAVNFYDPYHGGRLIESYVPDKKGWLREVKSEMKGIDTDTVSDRYIKTERMSAP